MSEKITTEVVVTELGMGFEAVGIHPRLPGQQLQGYSSTEEKAVEDYLNRYRQEHWLSITYGLYDAEYGVTFEVEVDKPRWDTAIEEEQE